MSEPKRECRLFLADIRDAAKRISDYVKGKSLRKFAKTQMLLDAVVRNLEIIGEAVKNLPSEVRQRYPQIEWKKFAGLRDMVIHKYFGIDYEILWDIVQHKIPDLLARIQEILKKESQNSG